MLTQWRTSYALAWLARLVLVAVPQMLTVISLSWATPPDSMIETRSGSATRPGSHASAKMQSGFQFQTGFEKSQEFYDRFVYFVGNHCAPYSANTCRIESMPVHNSPGTWHGDHSMACEAPTTSRTVNAQHHVEYFWWCAPGHDPLKGHVMTAQNTTGYGIVAFSPNQDFTDVKKVCWDVNATDMGGGKWTNVILIPASEYVRHPNLNPKPDREGEGPYRLDYVSNGFNKDNGPGDFNIQAHDLQPGHSIWGLKNFRGVLQLYKNDAAIFNSVQVVVTSDKAARYRHCFFNNADSSLTITRNRPNGATDSYRIRNVQIPTGKIRVIFQDDNYDPPKRDGYDPNVLTWHWDNILIE
jgi:hypothetical protein